VDGFSGRENEKSWVATNGGGSSSSGGPTCAPRSRSDPRARVHAGHRDRGAQPIEDRCRCYARITVPGVNGDCLVRVNKRGRTDEHDQCEYQEEFVPVGDVFFDVELAPVLPRGFDLGDVLVCFLLGRQVVASISKPYLGLRAARNSNGYSPHASTVPLW
jgi:hypothetical protein